MKFRIFVLFVSVAFVACFLNGCSSSSNSYEDILVGMVQHQIALIEDCSQSYDVKKELRNAATLAFCVHSWEVYSFKGQLAERSFAAASIKNILRKELSINMPQLMEKIRDEKNADQCIDDGAYLKDRIYSALLETKKAVAAKFFFVEVNSFDITFFLECLPGAISKKDAKGIDVGKSLIVYNIDALRSWSTTIDLPQDLIDKVSSLSSVVSSTKFSSKGEVTKIKKMVNSCINDLELFILYSYSI